MFMLSIEKGRVYAENYNLSHVLKAAYSSPAKNPDNIQPVYGPGLYLNHRHVQLTRYAIPENLDASAIAGLFSSIDYLAAYPASSGSLKASPFQKQLGFCKRLKLPIAPLLQSSALLI